MNKRRILLTALALILVCALSIMGTVAYLEAQTNTVTNTFVAAGGAGPFVDKDDDGDAKFELLEYEVEQSASGKYTKQTTTTNTGIAYAKVMPGTVIPKQAFVKLSRTGTVTENGVTTTYTPAPAYLYIEVINGMSDDYEWSVDSANWTELSNVTGPNNGKVYVYSTQGVANILTTVAADTKIDILTDDKITVADVTALSELSCTLTFNAYLAQASTGESDAPADVFNACFAVSGGNQETTTTATDAIEYPDNF